MADDIKLVGGASSALYFVQGGTSKKIINSSGYLENTLVGDVTGNTTGVNGGNVSEYSATGDIAVTDKMAILDSSGGALAMALADGTEGQRLVIKCDTAGSNAVVTPAHLADGATLTFDAADETAILIFDGTNWQLVYNTSTLG